MKKKLYILSIIMILFIISSCQNNSSNYTSETSDIMPVSSGIEEPYFNILPVSYNQVKVQTDMDAFYKETRNSNGRSHDEPLDYGFVKSVWHKLKINNISIPVYSARCGYGIHSFAYVDIDTNQPLELDINLEVENKSYKKVTVLPEKENVVATISNGIVKCKISNYGNFSFSFDDLPDMAITLYVAEHTKMEIPEGYSLREIEPGYYDNEENSLNFTDSKTVYLFKKGVYDATKIVIPADSIAYFELGTYFRVYEYEPGDYNAVLSNSGNNVKILGRSLFDFSKCVGGEAKTKAVYGFNGENIYVEGIVTINSNNWSLCFNASNNCEVSKCMFFSYRTYSDGIMFSDCQNSYIHDNFVRTGDDAIEVKAFTGTNNETDNIVFENNSVWTDKGIAYGCIYESVHDVKNVYFKNNSVGFAQASWSEHLGCCTMQMGSMKDSTWHDVHFENIEVYKTSCALISIYNRALDQNQGGKIKDIYFKNITAKYAYQINLPVYCLNFVIRLADDIDYRNTIIGSIYLDNINYLGTEINKNNYLDYTNIALSDSALFSKSNIKFIAE